MWPSAASALSVSITCVPHFKSEFQSPTSAAHRALRRRLVSHRARKTRGQVTPPGWWMRVAAGQRTFTRDLNTVQRPQQRKTLITQALTTAAPRASPAAHLLRLRRVEAAGGLVHEDERRRPQQLARDGQALLLAAADAARLAVAHGGVLALVQPQPGDGRVHL